MLYLQNSGGAHDRYRPINQKKNYVEWHMYLKEGHNNDKGSLLKRYKEACEDFPPVFNRYFLDCWPEPQQWFYKRLLYTRSVAVASMCGYILGLGDRHNANILLDKHTAELIHIDLGVAFDLGKVLKTPEIVPFRLTRDVVDPMGVTGVEGVFRRCCEETMRVLRTNEEMLLTVLEVFVHDPLYKWALSPQKIMRLRPAAPPASSSAAAPITAAAAVDDAAASSVIVIDGKEATDNIGGEDGNGGGADANGLVNVGAQRAMLGVTAKLRGSERGTVLSVEGQVRALITEATDPQNLAFMYYGWSPIC